MSNTVTACLIVIGNEILSGRTQDKNLSYLATRLNEAGIQLREARVVPDIEEVIIAAVNECRAVFDYVFTTGGIGPTHDDITSLSIAKAFGVPLQRHPVAVKLLEDAYRGTDKLNEARLKMADVPEGSILIPNSVTAAPGFQMENVFVMAGVPKICQAMIETIIPQLRGGSKVLSANISTNLPEGAIADGLTGIQANFPDVEIGSYPHFIDGGYRTTLVLRSPDAERNALGLEEIRRLILGLDGLIIDSPAA